MATLKQMLANRRNAKKSCGPKSPETKEIVFRNATKHGLCGNFRVLDFEDQARYDDLLEQFVRDEKPVGSAEHELVVKMARHTWMSHRCMRMQDACFVVDPQTPEQKVSGENAMEVRTDMDRYIRYQVQHDRAYQRASQELIQRRKERLKAEIGFESKKAAEAQEQRRENHENRRVETHKTASALGEEKLTQAKLKTALLQHKLSRSQNSTKSLTNSDSDTYMPAAA